MSWPISREAMTDEVELAASERYSSISEGDTSSVSPLAGDGAIHLPLKGKAKMIRLLDL